jgi:hypothetical protein
MTGYSQVRRLRTSVRSYTVSYTKVERMPSITQEAAVMGLCRAFGF